LTQIKFLTAILIKFGPLIILQLAVFDSHSNNFNQLPALNAYGKNNNLFRWNNFTVERQSWQPKNW